MHYHCAKLNIGALFRILYLDTLGREVLLPSVLREQS